MASELLLLDLNVSPFAARVRIALEEKGLEYESREEDLDNKSPLLLEMNPVYKQVPVLIHKWKPISESSIIVQYIDEVWNHKSPLLPSDPYERAHARFWVDYIDKKIYPCGNKLWNLPKCEAQESAKKELMESFKTLEAELGDKPYFGSNSFNAVDITLIPFYSFFHSFEKLGNLSMVKECPKLVEWGERCMHKESVSKSVSDPIAVYEAVLEIKRNLGL
ncbi:hypothetical protein COLO4_17401 [Corchorus olitorius]|uniref:Glutathione S-transferase n=1 Tax=Corchorus olitorius TaxID=93759 RepID=A0A1R3JCX4_9ROSI|nr:hypothetical protein COLO4_17401 [Corchorus olitorius]